MSLLTPEQRALRRTGIGGSEIAAVAGLSPYEGPWQVWARKVGAEVEREDNDHTWYGRAVEAPIIERYAMLTGRATVEASTRRHPRHERVVATPDALSFPLSTLHRAAAPIELCDRIVEVKAPDWRTAQHWGPPGTDEIPTYYIPQVTWECAVYGLSMADVVALIGRHVTVYHVPFDEQLFEALAEVAAKFWRDHVITEKPPPIDGSDAAAEWLREHYPMHRAAELAPAPPEAEPWMQLLAQARMRAADAERDEQRAKNQLQALIGDGAGFEGAGWKVSWRHDSKGRADWKAIATELGATPEMIAKHTPAVGPRKFLPRWDGETK